MAKSMVVTSGKGGVGKSSVSINIAYGLCDLGFKVCLIDADLGLKNLDVMLGLENRTIYDLQDIVNGNCVLEQALIKDKRFKNLSLLPACKTLSLDSFSIDKLKSIVNIIKLKFDYIIIDSPAGIEKGFNYAISLVQEAIIVVNLDIASLRDADRVVGILLKEGMQKISLVINRVNYDDIYHERTLSIEDALEVLSLPLLGIVYDDHRMIEANNKGIPIYQSKDSILRLCFKNICLRIEGQEVPFLKLKKKTWINRLFKIKN